MGLFLLNKAREEVVAGARSEGGAWTVVNPLGEVKPGDHTGVAGDPRVYLEVRQDEDSELEGLDTVRVIAEQSRHREAPDLLQLLDSEAAGPASVLVPEPVSDPDVVELTANDAGEGRAQETSRHGVLSQAGTEELQVLRGVVEPLVGGHRPVTHQAAQLLPPSDRLQSAELTEPAEKTVNYRGGGETAQCLLVVRGNPVLPASL